MEWHPVGQPRLILDQDAQGRWHVLAYYEPAVSAAERQEVLEVVQAALDRREEVRRELGRLRLLPSAAHTTPGHELPQGQTEQPQGDQ